MSPVMAERASQLRDVTQAAVSADARQYATPDHGPDYQAYYEAHVDAYLADPDATEYLAEALGRDAHGARLLRTLIVDVDDRIRGRRPEGDLIEDMRVTIRALADRAADLAWQPLCEDMDYEIRQHADRAAQMRRHGEIIE